MEIKSIKSFIKDNVHISILDNRNELGKAAAENVEKRIKKILENKSEVRIIFAAAPSQNEFLAELIKADVDWNKITVFHMDEYIGLKKDSPQLFGKYLYENIFKKVNFKRINLIHPIDNPNKECKRYEALLKEKPIDLVCMGIGENGHIAFNDPPVADFNDSNWVKIVELDQLCRRQQVNDGCFVRIEDVPKKAITLTIPALISAEYLSVVVPGIRKAAAVKKTFSKNIGTDCPSTILRNHPDVSLFLDKDSASEIINE